MHLIQTFLVQALFRFHQQALFRIPIIDHILHVMSYKPSLIILTSKFFVTRSRTMDEFSPMPALKMMASTLPSSTAVYAPMYLRTLGRASTGQASLGQASLGQTHGWG